MKIVTEKYNKINIFMSIILTIVSVIVLVVIISTMNGVKLV